MRGRLWLLVGAAVGVAVAFGHVPWLAGAGRSLADTAERLVGSGGQHLIADAARRGAPERTVAGATAVVGVLLPGITALLAVVAARSTLRLRAVVGLAVVALGAASYVYHPHGVATGVVVLALAVAGLAVAASGPLVVAPLCGLAGLICGAYLPSAVRRPRGLPGNPVGGLHQALTGSVGDPLWTAMIIGVAVAVPFAVALRLILR